jgi:hypothetical protein
VQPARSCSAGGLIRQFNVVLDEAVAIHYRCGHNSNASSTNTEGSRFTAAAAARSCDKRAQWTLYRMDEENHAMEYMCDVYEFIRTYEYSSTCIKISRQSSNSSITVGSAASIQVSSAPKKKAATAT